MRYLIAESISLKPHLETGGEIALQKKEEGHEIGFTWLGYGLPWSDWNLPKFSQIIGCSLKRRVAKFENVLSEQGVEVLSIKPDKLEWMILSQEWAYKFSGDLSDLKEYSFQGASLGVGVASSLISYTGNSCYDPKSDLGRARKCLASALLVYLRAREVIKDFKPDFVVTFNGRFATAKPIIDAAESLGVKVLRHERGHSYTHYEIFSKSIHNFSYICKRISDLWKQGDPNNRHEIGHKYFWRRRGGDGIGWYSFTERQHQGMAPRRILNKRRLVYFSSSDDEFAAITDINDQGPWADQLSAVRDLISVIKGNSGIELIVRVHPHMLKKSAADLNRWHELAALGAEVILPQDPTDSYALLDSADIVLSFGSTMGIEATYWRKPSILLGPAAYRGTNVAFEPSNKQEIEALLSQDLIKKIPAQDGCLPFGYYHLSYGFKFKYYNPQNLSEGLFMGRRLGWDPWLIYMIRRIKKVNYFTKLIR
ncbi:hypothetical protein G6704_01635 [Polynucleobacter paneuropaeus]|nr:hypothetical protein G6704_01635 [Polynucleobacter paneuropaeus]